MKAPVKPFFLLFSLVLTIYVMRHGDISIGSMVKRVLDDLREIRPSASLCKGTSLEQVYTQSEIDRAKSFKESLQGMRGGNPMMELLTEKELTGQAILDYLMGALAFIVPWAAMFIISILSAIVITCNWCCIYGCCKKAKCCKCCKEPKDSSKKRIYVFISAIFALAGIGSGIAGIVVAGGVPKGIELTMCSTIAIVEDLTYGVSSDHWLGVKGAIGAIDDLLAQIDTISGHLTKSTGSMTDVQNAQSAVLTELSNMITALDVPANKNWPRPDPKLDTTQSSGQYTPIYIANVGPRTQPETMTGMIQAEVDYKYQVISTAQTTINQAVDDINTAAASVKTEIGKGRSKVEDYYSQTQDALESVNDFGSIGKSVITGIGAGLTAIFAATLTFSIFAVGAMILVGLLKMKSFNKFLHSSWMGFTIMSIFGFLLSTILYPLSLVLMETCDVLQTALDDSSVMNKLLGNVMKDNDVGGVIDLCLNGDGDIITYFELDSTLSQFKDFNDQFTLIENATGITIQTNTPRPPSIILPIQYDLADAYKTGKYPDGIQIDIDLKTLNDTVSHTTNDCTDVFDIWAYNSDNCTDDKGKKFLSTYQPDDNIGSPTCIGFNQWPNSYSAATRYGTHFQSCGTVTVAGSPVPTVTYVNSFVANFKTNRDQVSNLFGGNVKTQLDNVQSKYNDFADKMVAIINNFGTLKNDLTSVDAFLYDPNTGLFENMNCNFIGDGIRRMSDSMCVGFISSLYQSSVVIIICSVMSFFGAIFVFCLAKRFILEDPNTKPKPI